MIKTPEITYTRLPGKGLRRQGFFSTVFIRITCTLWLANDHILNVDNRGFSEDYKRFYFRDIQAIVTQETNRGKVWNLILATFIGLFVLIAFGSEEIVAVILWLVVAGILGIILFINWLWGPTCACHIVTAVQKETLSSLDRLKTAEKVIKILKRLIREAQGEFDAGEAQTAELSYQPNTSDNRFHFTSRAKPTQSVRHYHGRMHGVFFFLLLVDGMLACIHLLFQHVALSLVSSVLTIAFSICVIVALVKQYNTDIPKRIRLVTWSSFGYVWISYIVGYILTIYLSFLTGGPIQRGMNQWEYFKTVAELPPYEYPLLLGIYIVFILCSFLLGGIGLIFLRRFRQEYTTPPPLNIEYS
jgi:hypothetical protein